MMVNKNVIQYFVLLGLVTFLSCSVPKTVQAPAFDFEEILLDSIQIVGSRITPENKYQLPLYNPSEKRHLDILHTKLDLSFDWKRQAVLGKAWITIKPLFHAVNIMELDAENFEIHAVKDHQTQRSLDFQYDQKTLSIQLADSLTRFDPPVTVMIDYTAFPAIGSGDLHGAISSNQGLFFIDHLDQDADLPMQIWTQGETENNRRWFPTIDHPNERMTQEFVLTVEDRFETLSNGALISSVHHTNGTRTDTWKMHQSHAPYLAMIAVGDFAIIKDQWRDVPVSYYVEHPYTASAKTIFNHTTEMLEFFSNRLGYDFPWPKYDQIVVRDFVSGAMENTTAVVFGDFVQDHADNFLIENENDYIVSHELIHHWFGNLVTCESWANLTLNEGFANYGEYLWFEYKYGKNEADYTRLNEMKGYFRESAYQMHPLIHYGYEDKDDMFDAHSYNKGGLVLHMLRSFLGDDVFFSGVQYYLKQHAFKTAEIHDLRIAFEYISGEDLNWFFNQWYLSSGHPVLDVKHNYTSEKKLLQIEITQIQDPEKSEAIFQLPMHIDLILPNGSVNRELVWLNKRHQRFEISVDQKPQAVLLNGDDALLLHVINEYSKAENKAIISHAKSLRHRLEALQSLVLEEAMTQETYATAFNDTHWSMRSRALDAFDGNTHKTLILKIRDLAQNDPDARVRLSALEQLAVLKDQKAPIIAEKWLVENQKSEVVFTCLEVLVDADVKNAKEIINKLNNQDNEALQAGKAMIFSADGGADYASFFQNHLGTFNQYLEPFLDNYLIYFGKQDKTLLAEGLNSVIDYIGGSAPPYLRYQAMNRVLDFLVAIEEGNLKSSLNKEQKADLLSQAMGGLKNKVKNEENNQWRSIMNRLLEDANNE
jgi:aminopeptidase N